MATNIGYGTKVPYSAKWNYADFSNNRWNGTYFVTTVTVYTQYQHLNVSYQGAYTETGAMPYWIGNANADGSAQAGYSASEYVAISYQQYTGLKWGRTFDVYIPRGTTQKTCYIASQSPGWTYAFWNYEVGGNATTPTFSWADPTVTIGVDNETRGSVTFNISNYDFADGAVPASFSSEVLYCDTNSTPTTVILNNSTVVTSNSATISVNPNVTYYWKYIITDDHGTSKTYTGSFLSYGNPPVINYVMPEVTATTANVNYIATYDVNAEFSSLALYYNNAAGDIGNVNTINLTGLVSNSTYYYSLVVTDTKGRSSTASTGFFTTWAEPVEISNAYIRSVDVNSVTGVVEYPNQENVERVLCSVLSSDGLTTIQSNLVYTPSGEDVFTFYDLTRGTDYILHFRLRIKGSLIWTDPVEIEFSTLPDTSVYLVNSDGTIDKHGIFYGLGKTELLDSITYVSGGLDTLSTTLQAMIDNFIPESGYSYVRTTNPIIVAPSTSYTLECDPSVQFEIFEFQNGDYKNYTISSTLKVFTTTSLTNNVMIVFRKNSPFSTTDLESLTKTLYKTSLKKKITKKDIVKVSGMMRYIDIGQSGNSINNNNYICEIEVYDDTDTNVALSKTVTLLKGTSISGETYCVDGDKTTINYTSLVNSVVSYGDTALRIDLGSEYKIKKVVVYRYYTNTPIYYKTYVYGRNSNKELCYKFDDYTKNGLYAETSLGKEFNAVYDTDDNSLPVINSIVKDPIENNLIGTKLTVNADRSGYGG